MKAYIMALSMVLSVACSTPQQGSIEHSNYMHAQQLESGYYPPPGSNEKLRSPITLVDGLEAIVSDVVIPPKATVPRHYHPGEEFIYVIEGSAIHIEEGKADVTLKAGDTYGFLLRQNMLQGGARKAHEPSYSESMLRERTSVFQLRRNNNNETTKLSDSPL